jgi:hypothetical protein
VKTIIKKSKNQNQYVLTANGLWIRDFTKGGQSLDINNLLSEREYGLLATNESQNQMVRMAPIDMETIRQQKAVIVSDGHNFAEVIKAVSALPRSVAIIGVNGVLNKWPSDLRMNYYIANNPYVECMSFLPCVAKVPKVIVSNRTYPAFVRHIVNRKIVTYKYSPTPTARFGKRQASYTVDDYRNPVCAATHLAYKFGVSQLAIVGCDESFEKARPGAVELDNGLFTYSPHVMSDSILDGMLFWMKKADVKVANASYGSKLNNADYISLTYLAEWFR